MNENNTQAPPPEPKSKSGGGFGWLVLVLIIVGTGYAYSKGWLDSLIEKYVFGESVEQPLELDQAETSPRTEPLSIQPAVASEINGLIAQIGALQTRVISLETTSRQLQALSEQFAEQVVNQQFTGGTSVSATEIGRLHLAIIDLKLQINGDPQAAIGDLDKLAQNLTGDSELLPLIETNRARLATAISRRQILEQFTKLETQIINARTQAQSELEAASAPDPEATQLLGIFSSLIKVSRDSTQEVAQLTLIDQLAAVLPMSLNALLGGTDENYLKSLDRLQQAANALNNHNPTVVSSEITRTVSELISAGYPSNHLVLELPSPAS